MQDIDRTLELIAHCRLNAGERFGRQHQRGHDRSAQSLWHAVALDRAIQRDGELLGQHYYHEQVKNQHHDMKAGRSNFELVTMIVLRICRSTCARHLHKELTMPAGLCDEKNPIKDKTGADEKNFLH